MMNLFSAGSKEKVVNKVVSIPIEIVISNRNQPRVSFDQKDLYNLAQSIKENGVIQPITVRKLENGIYELVAGERRVIASKMAGKTTVPAIIMSVSDKQSAVFALLENLQRKDLNFFEEAQGIWELINQYEITQDEAARQLGKSQSTIANKLRILRLSEKVRNAITDNNLTERHARGLLKLDDEKQQLEIINIVIDNNLNVKQTEEIIDKVLFGENNIKNKKEDKQRNTVYIIKDVRLFANTISKAIDTMKQSGVEAVSIKNEYEDMIEYIVRIPKNKVLIKRTAC